MRNHRRPDKRRAYSEYSSRMSALNDQLVSGKISQDEFDRHSELLDEMYGWVK
jgi:hypothetical protein